MSHILGRRLLALIYSIIPDSFFREARVILEKVVSEEDKVLDLGGGTGHLVSGLGDYRLVLDIDDDLLKIGKKRGYDVERIAGSALKVPLRSSSINVAVINDAFHHFPEHNVVLREVNRVLIKSGELILLDFNGDHIISKLLSLVEKSIGLEPNYVGVNKLLSILKDKKFGLKFVDKKGLKTRIVAQKTGEI